jgi:hypothetical protein
MRKNELLKLKDHAWFGRVYEKMSPVDLEMCFEFIEKNDHLEKGEFEMAVNRMFIDKEKPKKCAIIMEMLTTANINSFQFHRKARQK